MRKRAGPGLLRFSLGILISLAASRLSAAAASSSLFDPPHVLLLVGANDELEVFDAIGGENLRIVAPAQTQGFLSAPNPLAPFKIMVWGRNQLRDAPRSLLSDDFQKQMQDFVKDGGDLIFFEQFGQGNMDVVEKMFGIKVDGGPTGAEIVDPLLRARAAASGCDEPALKKLHYYNSYSHLPKHAQIWIRGSGKSHPATGVIIPYGQGRLILLATTMDEANKELDKQFFDLIYHYSDNEIVSHGMADVPRILGNPMDWKPPESPPPLRELLDAGTYDRRFQEALSRIDVRALRDPGRPREGDMVFLVTPNTPADIAGMRAGDVITAYNGVPIRRRNREQEDQAPGTKRQVTFWSQTGGEKTIETTRPRFGFWSRDVARPVESYARSNDHDPRWDKELFVAAASYLDDPDLAETALLHAQKAGYNGLFLDPMAERIAFRQFRYDDALAFGWHLMNSGRRLPADMVRDLYLAAMLDFKLEQAKQIAELYPDAIPTPADIDQLIKAYRAMPVDRSANPISRLEHLNRKTVDPYSNLVPYTLNESVNQMTKWAAGEFTKHKRIDFNIPSDHSDVNVIDTGCANVCVTANYDMYPTDDQDGQYMKLMQVGLIDLGSPPLDPTAIFTIDVSPFQEIMISAFGFEPPLLWAAPPHLNWQCRGQMKIVILHNRCEATINGHRIFYGPVFSPEKGRHYGILIRDLGLSGRLEAPVVEKLDDAATTQP